jgi:SAM-dependent methyltransferase
MTGDAGGGGERPAALPQAAVYWEKLYGQGERPWGESPSELAILVVARLRPYVRPGVAPSFTLLEIGCGYGRDSRYFASELGCAVTAIDPAPSGIAVAQSLSRKGPAITYVVADAASFAAGEGAAGAYDVVVAGQVYPLLGPTARREFTAAVSALVPCGGLLFLSALSPRDPEHYAVGRPAAGEARSWISTVYRHFCTAEELTADFAAFDVLDIEERAYEERKPNGLAHRHASWFLEGRRR